MYIAAVMRLSLRCESALRRRIHIPFDNSLEMMDESILSSQFVEKNVFGLKEYTDSLAVEIDSIRHINAQSVVDNRYVTTFSSSAGRSQTVPYPIMSEVIQSEHVASTQAEEPVAEPPVVDRQPVNEYLQLSSEEREIQSICPIPSSGASATKPLLRPSQDDGRRDAKPTLLHRHRATRPCRPPP